MKTEHHKSKIRIAHFAASVVIYAGFAVYLYQPHFKKSGPLQYLVVVNICLAALGCFLLSRRWIAAFWGSFFAGAVYGFGPFVLGLSFYHPMVGLLLASIPWLFCPASLCSKRKRRWVSVPLSALPFLAILLAFQISAYYRLFPIPIQTSLNPAELAGSLAPLVALERTLPLVGFYHVPLAALLLGCAMLLKARRLGIMAIFAAGIILTFCGPFRNVSPIIWLTIPVLCCSVVIGVGMQGIVSAGHNDRKWILMTAVIMSALAIVALLLATKYNDIFAGLGVKYARLFMQTAKMYILGAIAVSVIFFMASAKLRLSVLRWALIGSATAVDIFLGARFIVDRLL